MRGIGHVQHLRWAFAAHCARALPAVCACDCGCYDTALPATHAGSAFVREWRDTRAAIPPLAAAMRSRGANGICVSVGLEDRRYLRLLLAQAANERV